MISLILLKLFTFSQILQGVPKLLHATVYTNSPFIPSKHSSFMHLHSVIVTSGFDRK